MKKKFLSLILSFSLAFGLMATPVYAAPEDEKSSEQTVEEKETEAVIEENDEVMEEATEEKTSEENKTEKASEEKKEESKNESINTDNSTYSYDVSEIDVTGVGASEVVPEDGVEVDESNPEIVAAQEELESVEVLNEEGESVALTEEQIQSILYMYNLYLDQWKDHADILGVQTPFFLQFNDKKDDLGGLGEMLVLAGYTVDDVRNGNYSYDDLMGMIQNFYYADNFAISKYSDKIKESRDEVVEEVENSGAKTAVQKILVINDWLAHQTTFEMAYIMNMGEDEPVMVAENAQKHEYYDEIHETIYDLYHDSIEQQFHDQIYEGVKAQFRQQYYENAIRSIIYQQELDKDEADATEEEKNSANDAADIFMDDHAEAISNDAAGFVEDAFGAEAAAQISAGADAFIAEAEETGVEVAPGQKMTIEQITQQQMKQPLADLGGMTPNEATEVFTNQAADGLTDGIINAWLGNHVGVLAEGKAVCAGYAKAFAYLLQYMSPEVYGVDASESNMDDPYQWKSAEELYYDENGNIDISAGYTVDMVRITFDAEVTMYGEKADNFGGDHFWNAVRVDGIWYYVDPCYTDVYTEVMSRDRVEMDGSMNHLYFMFSHDTAEEIYDGNMKEIKSLYSEAANDTSYESSWYSRIACNTYSDRDYFYYIYDSTDMLDIMREYNSSNMNFDDEKIEEMKNPTYKLVRHEITDKDIVNDKNGDNDYDTLIEFNAKNDDGTTVAKVKNKNKEMVENETLTKLFAKYKTECSIYPSVKLTSALSGNKLYFNLSNYILSYNLTTCEVKVEKEYSTVYGKRDKTEAFGGMAFDVVTSKSDADFTVENRPISAMTIKEDGEMYVSIATNFAYISGKDSYDDTSSYGYEFEESNYNPDYSRYMENSNHSDDTLAQMGYTKEKNDNDEFMWSAVFVDNLSVPDSNGDLSEVEVEECEHHYIHFDETYYTKDEDSGEWNTGDSYVCTICGYAVESDDDGTSDDWDDTKDTYKDAEAKSGHTYEPEDADWDLDNLTVTFSKLKCTSVCPEKKDLLDCLIADGKDTVTLKEKETVDVEVTGKEGYDCTNGGTVTYTAAGTVKVKGNDYKYSISKEETEEADGKHHLKGTFTWAKDYSSATVTDVKCSKCGTTFEGKFDATVSDPVVKEATCEKPKQTTYKATAVITEKVQEDTGDSTESEDEENTEDVVVTDKKVVTEGKAKGHEYGKPEFSWAEDYSSATATSKCANCSETQTIQCEVNSKTTKATCTIDGKTTYTASCKVDGKTYTDEKTNKIEAIGHEFKNPEFSWAKDYSSATATFKCTRCDETDGPKECDITSKTAKAKCETDGKTVYTATCDFNGETYTNKQSKGLPAIGHNYGDPEFKWIPEEDKDGKIVAYTCEATVTCANNTKHQEHPTCTVTPESKDGDCTTPGTVTYSASCEYNGKIYNSPDTKTVEGFPVGHIFESDNAAVFTWTWDDEKNTYVATAKITCDVCHETFDATCGEAKVETTPADYQKAGKTVYSVMATFENTNGHTEKIPGKKTVAIPKKDAKTALSKSSISIYANETIQLKLASEFPEDQLLSVNKSSIASTTIAKDGKSVTIKGTKAGNTTLTFKTASNETVSVKVEVKAATLESATNTEIIKVKENSDPANSTFRTLKAKVSSAKSTSLTLKWSKVSGAKGYIIYGSKCGSKFKRIGSTTKTSYTQKKLKKGTYYKYIVVAYKKVAAGNIVIARSKSLHAVTTGSKYTNPSSVKPSKTKVTLSKAGKTYTLKVKTTISKGKKMKTHKKVAFESSNTKVATVSSKGKITAKGRGSCYIYVYAQNGAYKAVKVTVSK